MAELWILLFTLFTFAFFWGKTKKKKLPPGPTGLPLVGCLPFLSPDLHRYFATLAERYGPITSLRLGTKLFVIVSSSSAAKELLKDRDAIFAFRDVPVAAAVITKDGADVGWNNDAASWRFLRKIMVRELLPSSGADGFSRVREREMKRIMKELYERRGEKVMIWELAFGALLNIIFGMIWGETLDKEERETIGKKFTEIIHKLGEVVGVPNISDLIPMLAPLDIQGVKRRMKMMAARTDEVLDRVIGKRLDMGGERDERGDRRGKDFLQVMLDIFQEAETPMTIDCVKGVILDVVSGATDTTSSTIEFAMAEVMGKPEVLEKIKSELELVVGNESAVEESHLPRLHYLNAVVKEALRMHPPIPLLVPRTPSESSYLDEYHVPIGSRILVNAWAIHRDPSMWDNPSEFMPERFLKGEKSFDFNAVNNGFLLLPFGSGRRACPGIPLAKTISVYTLATLLHSFDWKLPVGDRIDFTEAMGLVLRMEKPLALIPLPRFPNLDLYS